MAFFISHVALLKKEMDIFRELSKYPRSIQFQGIKSNINKKRTIFGQSLCKQPLQKTQYR